MQSKTGNGALKYTPLSGSVSSSGNNLLITPASGKRIRLHFADYNPAAAVEAAFRFGTSGQLFLRHNIVVAGSIIMKDFGDVAFVEGAVDEPLYLNLSGAVTTLWNTFHVEV